jgi:LuxR family maltose regulon positive regulatory protein
VVEDTGERVPVTPALDHVMLDTKLTAPPRRPGMASRRDVIEVAAGSGARIVGVTAPAGYGKSTLLAEWASRDERAVAWVSLDRFDDDPAAVLTLLATAFEQLFPGTAGIAARMRGPGAASLGRSAPLLASALSRAPHPFLLLVDDLHEVGSPACQDVLEVALNGVPEGSLVVLASRHEQAHLARRRASGDVHEIHAADLRADAAAARTIFAAAGAEISDADLDDLLVRSEGWPVGLFLAALVVRGGGTASVAGDDRFVADYLYRECVRNLPEDVQAFLRRTAVLEQLSGPLCDATTGRSDGASLLRELEANGLFLMPLDHRRGWYRYHALFREFLLAELGRTEPTVIPELEQRAAAWYEDNGLPIRAIEHLLAAGDRSHSVHLVAAVARTTYQAGQVSVVTRWLAELGDAAIESYPPLAILAAWAGVLTGEPADAERWADMVERTRYDDVAADDLPSFESARAMLRAAMCANGHRRALEDAALAVATEPSWSTWRDLAVYLHGTLTLLGGDVDAARQELEEAAALGDRIGTTDAVLLALSDLAVVDIAAGRWSDAGDRVAAALDAIDEQHLEGYPTTALALAVGARLAWHEGDRGTAERLLVRGMRARAGCTYALPFVALRVRLHLAIAFAELDERVTAMHLLREIDDLLEIRPDVGTLADEVADLRRRLHGQSPSAGRPPLTPAELRLLPYLQTHLTLSEIGRRLFISRNTVSSEVGSIYRKLRVTTRAAAVEQAVAAGLLGE